MKISNQHKRLGYLVSILLLVTFGLVMLYSTSSAKYGQAMFKKQIVFCIIGISTALFIQFLDYRRLAKYINLFLILVALSLLYLVIAHVCYRAKIPFHFPLTSGKATHGAFRWLKLGGISVQPSEFLKIVVTFFIANYYSRNQRYSGKFFKGFFIPLSLAGIAIGLVLLGGDLSMTVIIAMITLGTAFVGGLRLRYLLLVFLLGIAGIFGISKVNPERLSRFETYQTPEASQKGDGYQLWLSELAIGSGGVVGIGFGRSRMKDFYLPDAHTDFIISIVGEELGFCGVVFIMILYLFIFSFAVSITLSAVDNLGTYLGAGLSLAIILPALFNIAVVSGYCPTTGITAPLLSYGGSSLFTTYVGIGLILSISRVSIESSYQSISKQNFSLDTVQIAEDYLDG